MTVRRLPADLAPLRSAADLTRVWSTVIAGEPIRGRVLWMLFLSGPRPVGPLLTLDDLPDGPYDVPLEDLLGLVREFLEGPGAADAVAFLLVRPGGDPWTVSDRAWGRFLLGAVEQLGTTAWPVHWAHRRRVEEFVLA